MFSDAKITINEVGLYFLELLESDVRELESDVMQ